MLDSNFQVLSAVDHIVNLHQKVGLLLSSLNLLAVLPSEPLPEEPVHRVLDVVEEVGVLNSLLPFPFLKGVVRYAQFVDVGVVTQQ